MDCICRLTVFKDDTERLEFLENLATDVDRPGSQDAFVSAKTATAGVKLRKGDLEGARQDLERSESILDTFDSVENTVHARFYSTNSDYYQVHSPRSLVLPSVLLLTHVPGKTTIRVLLSQCASLPRLHRRLKGPFRRRTPNPRLRPEHRSSRLRHDIQLRRTPVAPNP